MHSTSYQIPFAQWYQQNPSPYSPWMQDGQQVVPHYQKPVFARPDSKPIVRESVEYVYQSRERRPVSVNQAQSYSVHLMFAVFVLFLCNPLFGLIALIFAGMASSNAVSDPEQAAQQGRTSLGLSVAGVVVTLIIICVLIFLVLNGDIA